MEQTKCAQCFTAQPASAAKCSVCGSLMRRADDNDMPHASSQGAPATPPGEPILFPVSVTKFIVMDMATLGIYNIFWAYKNWEYYKSQRRQIRSGWRAWFSVFYLHGLLKEIIKTGSSFGLSKPFSPTLVFVPWLLLQISSRLPDPIWLITFFSFIPLISVLRYVNEINRVAGKSDLINSKFTLPNWIAVVLGSLTFIAAVLGSFIPDK